MITRHNSIATLQHYNLQHITTMIYIVNLLRFELEYIRVANSSFVIGPKMHKKGLFSRSTKVQNETGSIFSKVYHHAGCYCFLERTHGPWVLVASHNGEQKKLKPIQRPIIFAVTQVWPKSLLFLVSCFFSFIYLHLNFYRLSSSASGRWFLRDCCHRSVNGPVKNTWLQDRTTGSPGLSLTYSLRGLISPQNQNNNNNYRGI